MRKGPINISWFDGGVTNICYNALDRHVEAGNGDKVAFYWEGNDVGEDSKMTYSEVPPFRLSRGVLRRVQPHLTGYRASKAFKDLARYRRSGCCRAFRVVF